MSNVGLLMVLGGLLSLVMIHKHIISMLLSLEFAILGFVLIMISLVCLGLSNGLMVVIFLGFTVCEGVLGLGILINLVRNYGSDFYSSVSVIQC
uniref:NADH-ubiquinone oxidoreductase chain 4L n=1 Tax=Narceus annularis TaxID=174156 RepID=Q8WA94_NARAN|nr:NADH dehydrogenase subunit 4L [Narceus annularus]AAL18213.1 NADH dehydrogenase subunit 4L [Narceus annularus]